MDFNALDKYIASLNPTCWLNSQHVNGHGEPQPADGAEITEWKDISGNSNNFINNGTFTNVTTGAILGKPLFKATGPLNNLPALQTNNRPLLFPGNGANLWTNDCTIVFIATTPVNDNYNCITSYNLTGPNPGQSGLWRSGAFVGYPQVNGGDEGTRSYPVNRTKRGNVLSSIVVNKVAEYRKLYGTQGYFSEESNAYLNASTPIIFNNRQSIGGQWTIGDINTGNNAGFQSTSVTINQEEFIYEYIIFNKALQQQEILRVQSYIKSKYNI